MSLIEDVKAFHERYGIPYLSKPGLLDDATFDYRLKFLYEELDEFTVAHNKDDLVGAVDGLLDLVYVALGTLLNMGLSTKQIEQCWNTIQEANINKIRVSSADESKRGHSSDVRKPLDWVSPEKKIAVHLGLDVI